MTINYSDLSKKEKSIYQKQQFIVISLTVLVGTISLFIMNPVMTAIGFNLSYFTSASNFSFILLFMVLATFAFSGFIGALAGFVITEKLKLYTSIDIECKENRLEKFHQKLDEMEDSKK